MSPCGIQNLHMHVSGKPEGLPTVRWGLPPVGGAEIGSGLAETVGGKSVEAKNEKWGIPRIFGPWTRSPSPLV